MNNYSVKKTAVKVAVPASVIIIGTQLLVIVSSKLGVAIDDGLAGSVVTGLYALGRGLSNFLKNR